MIQNAQEVVEIMRHKEMGRRIESVLAYSGRGAYEDWVSEAVSSPQPPSHFVLSIT